MAAAKNDNIIPVSYDVISPFCGRQRKQFPMYYLPTKSHCHSFNALEVLKGGGGGQNLPPPRLRDENKAQAK